MKNFHVDYMDCSNKGRWRSQCQILLTEEQAIRKLQSANIKYSFGDFIFFIEASESHKQYRAWVWSESYQNQLHEQAAQYFQERLQMSKNYFKKYESNPLFQQIFKKMTSYSQHLNKKVQVNNLLDNYSEQHFNELYNIITFRNYWNFIKNEVQLKDFLREHEISEIYFTPNNNNADHGSKFNENQSLKNLNIEFELKYLDKIKITRCDCKYCQSLYYSKEYLDKIDWKIFDHLKESYIHPEELLFMLNKFEQKTILLFKDILNERVSMMETGQVISNEEIENSCTEQINDPIYSEQMERNNLQRTSLDFLDSSAIQTQKQLKKKLIDGEMEMTDISNQKQRKSKNETKENKKKKKDKKQKKQKNSHRFNLMNFIKDQNSSTDEDDEEQEEIEEIIQNIQMD